MSRGDFCCVVCGFGGCYVPLISMYASWREVCVLYLCVVSICLWRGIWGLGCDGAGILRPFCVFGMVCILSWC